MVLIKFGSMSSFFTRLCEIKLETGFKYDLGGQVGKKSLGSHRKHRGVRYSVGH